MAPDAPVLHADLFTAGPAGEADQALEHRQGEQARARRPRGRVRRGRRGDERPLHDPGRASGLHRAARLRRSLSADGQCQVWSSSQGQFMVRTYCAKVLDLDIANIRVTPAEIGGGFGGKTTVYLEPLALALSRQAGASGEAGDEPRGGVPRHRPDLRRGGRGQAGRQDATGPSSPPTSCSSTRPAPSPARRSAPARMTALACYDIPNFGITGYDVVTNTPKVAAYRAPGAPIAAFGVESAIDELARKLGMDPIELAVKNGVADGIEGGLRTDLRATSATSRRWRRSGTTRTIRRRSAPTRAAASPSASGSTSAARSTAAVHVNEDGTATVVTGQSRYRRLARLDGDDGRRSAGPADRAGARRWSPTPPRSAIRC